MKRFSLIWKDEGKPFRRVIPIAKILPGEKFELPGPYGLTMENKGDVPIFLGADGPLEIAAKPRKKITRSA